MVHTEDASQVVPAAASLVGEKKDSYIAAVKARQEELRNNHENKPVRDLLPLEKARELRWKGAEGGYLPPVPARLGPVSIGSLHSSVSCGCCSDDPRYYVTVQELIERMDWTPFSTPGSCTAHGTAPAGSSAPKTRPRLRRPRRCTRTPSACWNRP